MSLFNVYFPIYRHGQDPGKEMSVTSYTSFMQIGISQSLYNLTQLTTYILAMQIHILVM